MKVSLLLGCFPSDKYDEIVSNSKGVIQYAADALQKSFLEGLSTFFDDIHVINLPYIGSFPFRYKVLTSSTGKFSYVSQNGKCLEGENVKFLNLTGVKGYSRYVAAKRSLIKWCENYMDEEKVVLVYAIHSPFLKACVDAKRKCKSLKIILIVPDLPDYMSDNKSIIYRMSKKCDAILLKSLYPYVDGFVLLSKYMTEMLPIGNNSWTVVEGIFNNSQDDVLVDKKTSKDALQYIFYAGTLAKRYGVMNLVEAFMHITNQNTRLVICGAGDSEKEIVKCTSIDKRIIFKGQLPRIEVLKLQKESTLLVNPRTPEEEYTKFSFPSKTMEDLASGVPVLLYKLPGIPEEYYQYCYSIEDLSIECLTNKMNEILSLDSYELKLKGDKAREFILREKNPASQARKIVDLINSLY